MNQQQMGDRTYKDAVAQAKALGVSRHPDSEPFIKQHVDGLALVTRNGQTFWLNWWERFCYAWGITDEFALEHKYLNLKKIC
jgi:hypothetical protein